MSMHSGMLEREGFVFATNADSKHSNPQNVSADDSIISSVDDILEEALVNIKPIVPLTKRESEILQLIIAGNTNKKIAEKFYRTERTIEYHRNRLMRKLKAKSVADLIRNAILMGLA